MNRPYEQIAGRVSDAGDRAARMRALVDLLWETLAETGVSWVGFYTPDGDDEMIPGPSRNKPACSPIGMHGACGRAFRERQPLVVRDVASLGDNYVACDPRDLSEVVIPVFEPNGTCWGVLDVDSFDTGAFDETDVTSLTQLLRAAGLTSDHQSAGETIVI